MTDFLHFLNTASAETLTQVPGVTNSIAENIIAARPFYSVEDCLSVKGVGKSLLTKLELFAESQGNDSEDRNIIPVAEEAMPMSIEKSQPAEENVNEEPSFLSRMRKAFVNFLRALLRFVIIVLLIGGIGAVFYYSLPYINKTFVAPVEQNTARMNELENEVANLQTELAEMNHRLILIEATIETHTASIERLEKMQSTIETQLQDSNNKVLLELKHEVMLTRAFDMLARARLYLAQSNFGLAQADIQSARDVLFELQNDTNDEALNQAVTRLDLALNNLPEFPIVASGDLEIAWQILMSGEASVIATSTPTPVPFVETFTPTPFDVPSVTPTP